MKLSALLLVFALCLPGVSWAQSSPGLYNGQVPTAQQWNSYFQKKQDYPVSGYCADASVYANFAGKTAPTVCIPAASVVGVGSALKWTTPRTLTLSGSVSGSVSIDGSGDVTLTTSGGGTGTVTTTGTPSSGQMTKFSGASSITNAVAGTDYQAPISAGPGVGVTSNVISSLIAAGGLQPGGRLSLTSGQFVPTSDVTGASTLYYLCGRKLVPYYDGTNDQVDTISACQVSTALQSTGTGVLNSGGVFDVYWVHSGANRLCVVTNGSGGGWASDTGGSNTARGTGYSAVHNTRGYWTNTNALTHCYNGSTDYGSVAADQGTYLGSIYTTAAGQTSMQQNPAGASGGSNGVLGVFNAYNQVPLVCRSLDTATNWTYAVVTTWRPTDNSAANRCSYLDGLGLSGVQASAQVLLVPATNNAAIGINRDSTTATPTTFVQSGNAGASAQFGLSVSDSFVPSAGFHYVQAMEGNVSNAVNVTFWGLGFQALRINLNM